MSARWADEVADNAEISKPVVDENGIKTVIEYKTNDKGQKVKVIRKIKHTLVKSQVNHAVAERLALPKFGLATRPDNSTTTTVGETVTIRLTPGNKSQGKSDEDESTQKLRQALAQKSMITCRLCSGNHYTTRCPYKDTLGAVLQDSAEDLGDGPPDANAPGATNASGKYVPPSMREGAKKSGGESMYSRNRDDLPTLRVTNLSEEATEEDVDRLFRPFAKNGPLVRAFVGKDQETGLCKGFAFVSFADRTDADTARMKINGHPYDHLILSCQWSVPRTEGK